MRYKIYGKQPARVYGTLLVVVIVGGGAEEGDEVVDTEALVLDLVARKRGRGHGPLLLLQLQGGGVLRQASRTPTKRRDTPQGYAAQRCRERRACKC